MSDEAVGWQAQEDQWHAAVRQIAGQVGLYHRTLMALGLAEGPATRLALQYQHLLWHGITAPQEAPDAP